MSFKRPTWGSVRRGDVFTVPVDGEPDYRGRTYVVLDTAADVTTGTSRALEVRLTVLMSTGSVETWGALRDEAYLQDVLLREGQ